MSHRIGRPMRCAPCRIASGAGGRPATQPPSRRTAGAERPTTSAPAARRGRRRPWRVKKTQAFTERFQSEFGGVYGTPAPPLTTRTNSVSPVYRVTRTPCLLRTPIAPPPRESHRIAPPRPNGDAMRGVAAARRGCARRVRWGGAGRARASAARGAAATRCHVSHRRSRRFPRRARRAACSPPRPSRPGACATAQRSRRTTCAAPGRVQGRARGNRSPLRPLELFSSHLISALRSPRAPAEPRAPASAAASLPG